MKAADDKVDTTANDTYDATTGEVDGIVLTYTGGSKMCDVGDGSQVPYTLNVWLKCDNTIEGPARFDKSDG